jgi:hypothetical protein
MIYRVHSGQFRPDNLLQIREKVARRAIRVLPNEKRRNGLLIRVCTLLIDQSEAALKEGRFIYGIWLALRSVAVRPGLFASPLIGLWSSDAWEGVFCTICRGPGNKERSMPENISPMVSEIICTRGRTEMLEKAVGSTASLVIIKPQI